MKQKLILLLLCCVCTLSAVGQVPVTRNKPTPKPNQPRTNPRGQNSMPKNNPNQPKKALVTSSTRVGDNYVFTVKDVTFTMIYVQGGTFTMGSTSEQDSDAASDEKPTHSVTLSSYYIGETEVTQGLWQAMMGSNPSNFTGDSRLPVENVSWEDCKIFISKLNSLTGQQFRLPTEAQWEYAARGGNKSRGYKYSGNNDVSSVAWYYENSGNARLDDSSWDADKQTSNNCRTHPVKLKQPNELGIYDMSGNVWERCQDWYGSYSNSAQSSPTGPTSGSGRVCRGGGWSDHARYCRSSYRSYNTPSNRGSHLGLRLVL